MVNRNTTSETTTAADRDRSLERAIILQALRDDHAPRWSAHELAIELAAEEMAQVKQALARLVQEQVLDHSDEAIEASRPTRRLNELELIAV